MCMYLQFKDLYSSRWDLRGLYPLLLTQLYGKSICYNQLTIGIFFIPGSLNSTIGVDDQCPGVLVGEPLGFVGPDAPSLQVVQVWCWRCGCGEGGAAVAGSRHVGCGRGQGWCQEQAKEGQCEREWQWAAESGNDEGHDRECWGRTGQPVCSHQLLVSCYSLHSGLLTGSAGSSRREEGAHTSPPELPSRRLMRLQLLARNTDRS